MTLYSSRSLSHRRALLLLRALHRGVAFGRASCRTPEPDVGSVSSLDHLDSGSTWLFSEVAEGLGGRRHGGGPHRRRGAATGIGLLGVA